MHVPSSIAVIRLCKSSCANAKHANLSYEKEGIKHHKRLFKVISIMFLLLSSNWTNLKDRNGLSHTIKHFKVRMLAIPWRHVVATLHPDCAYCVTLASQSADELFATACKPPAMLSWN